MEANGNSSVVVAAPAAAAILRASVAGAPPLDERELLRDDNAALRAELDQSRVAMRTLASICVALARMVNQDDGPLDREIIIPRPLYDKLAGCEVGVTENEYKDLIVKIRDNVEHPVWEGR